MHTGNPSKECTRSTKVENNTTFLVLEKCSPVIPLAGGMSQSLSLCHVTRRKKQQTNWRITREHSAHVTGASISLDAPVVWGNKNTVFFYFLHTIHRASYDALTSSALYINLQETPPFLTSYNLFIPTRCFLFFSKLPVSKKVPFYPMTARSFKSLWWRTSIKNKQTKTCM